MEIDIKKPKRCISETMEIDITLHPEVVLGLEDSARKKIAAEIAEKLKPYIMIKKDYEKCTNKTKAIYGELWVINIE